VQRLVQALKRLQALLALIIWLIKNSSCRCLPQLCALQQRLTLSISVWLPIQAQLPCQPRRRMHPSGAALRFAMNVAFEKLESMRTPPRIAIAAHIRPYLQLLAPQVKPVFYWYQGAVMLGTAT